VLQRARLAGEQFGQVEPKHRAVDHRHVGAEPVTDADPDAELLDALPDQRVGLGLTRVDLATGRPRPAASRAARPAPDRAG
jgi:hypothetical protein